MMWQSPCQLRLWQEPQFFMQEKKAAKPVDKMPETTRGMAGGANF